MSPQEKLKISQIYRNAGLSNIPPEAISWDDLSYLIVEPVNGGYCIVRRCRDCGQPVTGCTCEAERKFFRRG